MAEDLEFEPDPRGIGYVFHGSGIEIGENSHSLKASWNFPNF